MQIGNRKIGNGEPCFIVAEMSANHLQDWSRAVAIVIEAAKAGADAIKTQCYRPDTVTINCDRPEFTVQKGPWAGEKLYDLYQRSFMPWEWHKELKRIAEDLGLIYFSTVSDKESVDFLDDLGMPCFKISSFELTDLPLIRYTASKAKPLIMSTGMADWVEIDAALDAVIDINPVGQIALLHCVSGYPAEPESMNVYNITDLGGSYRGVYVRCGLSDHSLGIAVPVAAVALGANIIEKHLTLRRSDGGPDAVFSLQPNEFKRMVDAVRIAEKAINGGGIQEEHTELRRSLYVVKDVKKGEVFTDDNVKSIRPAGGLSPDEEVIGKYAARDIERGEPLVWGMVELPGTGKSEDKDG